MLAIEGETELCFRAAGQTFQWRVLVTPIGDDGLLGMDFLCAHQFHLSAEEGCRLRGMSVALDWKGRSVPAG